jgi:glycine/D-amino acid oxidase-like deaminating enzyme
LIDQAEVVIIGAGSTGTSIAFHLAKRGVQNIEILEKGAVASGATGMSSALIRLRYWNKTTARIAQKAWNIFREGFNDRFHGDSGFIETGMLSIVSGNLVKVLRQNSDVLREIGSDCRLVTRDEIREIDQRMYVDDIELGLWEPHSGYADPVLTTNSYMQAAKVLGVQLFEQTCVTGISTASGRIKSVSTDRGEIATGKVVNAAGIWGKKVGALAGVQLPIHPSRVQGALFQRPLDFGGSHPIVIDYLNDSYCRPFGQGVTLVSSDLEDPGERDPDNIDLGCDWEAVEKMAVSAKNRFPALQQAFYRSGFAYLYDNTPDMHAILDEVGVEGFYCAVGMSGHGFKESPIIGEMMADFIANGNKKGSDIEFFRYSRFEEGKLITSPFID